MCRHAQKDCINFLKVMYGTQSTDMPSSLKTSVPSTILVSGTNAGASVKLQANVEKPLDKFWKTMAEQSGTQALVTYFKGVKQRIVLIAVWYLFRVY